MIAKFLVLAGAAPAALIVQPAQAQDLPASPVVDATTQDTDNTRDDIVVLGFGQSRQVQTVSATDMERLTPEPRR
ncbi:hypothetical protein GCM10020258_50400 [Sphingomonas yabuuchiae]